MLVWEEGSFCSTVVQPEKQTMLPKVRRQKAIVFIGCDLVCYLSVVVVVVVFFSSTAEGVTMTAFLTMTLSARSVFPTLV